ncbi:hypothetical protein CC85DRAFT_286596 [Cutaneotrichosporon oleaginosum]|uniref:Uncharacterized protein n=1 Tax=Cutaneotrichosporon oleaginosum TaxID=879819 RepID=A0A0J0XJP6_9TREE|nr:uncharacterized protein CC85DRAFT_286596 [Cutaneotrichosporon oleaginosum]KLT41276.1 hypothetical protein CC85DRAFT_286596 [Cutaneotrichosporon oleaginosum]TXT14026.1 hypothetical protein COLE_00219 [Cutaneotrichosporon oleaginosum]
MASTKFAAALPDVAMTVASSGPRSASDLELAHTSNPRPALDIAAYPHIFEAILAFSLAHYDTVKALRSLCHAARDAVEAQLARHITVKSSSTRYGKYLHIRSAAGVPIPGVRPRNYIALAQGGESALSKPVTKSFGRAPPAPPPADVSAAQALATTARVLAHTRVIDVGEFVHGTDLAALEPWLDLDAVRLPAYRLAGRNNDNTTLKARTVVLSPSCAGALRSTYALVVPPGTRRLVSHEFTDLAPRMWATVSCSCGGTSPTAGCACRTIEEVVVAFVQRRPAKGTSEMEVGYTPERVAALVDVFPNARVVLVGAEGARLGRDPPAQRPYGEPNDEIKRLILESELADKLQDINCVKLGEWRKLVGEKRWALEMGLGDSQVLYRAEGGWGG